MESSVCRRCGRFIDIFNPAVMGWITVADFAEATSSSQEEIMTAISDGDLDGQLVSGTWWILHE